MTAEESATTSTVDRSFLQAVRRAAGFRVAPRMVAPVIEALERRGRPVTPETVAQIVKTIEEGERSTRQRRHAELWRLLGAYLALDGKPAHLEAQRELIGRVRRILGERLPDRVLLQVAAALGAAGVPLEARTIADAIRWLESRLGPELTTTDLEPHLPLAAQAVSVRARMPSAPRRRRR